MEFALARPKMERIYLSGIALATGNCLKILACVVVEKFDWKTVTGG